MADLTYDVLWNDKGASQGAAKLAGSLDKVSSASHRAEDAQLKMSSAALRGRKASLELGAAQEKLAKVTASGNASTEAKARAELGVERAQLAVTRASRDQQRAQEELSTAVTAGNKSTGNSHTLLLGVGGAAAAGALALGKMVGAAASFDKQMSQVQAVAGASAAQIDQLRQAALQAGADTAFSASQAAEAEGELAKAGVSTADILSGALTGSLNLAAAGQLNLGDAASLSAQAMTIFKLKGTDVGHVADVLAAGANKSTADVSGLGTSMTYAGATAAAMGLSLEDTVGILALFSNHALNGEQAGTGLRGVLASLANPANAASTMMDRAGLAAFDAGGKFVGLANFAQQLHNRLGPLSQAQREQALVTIFGREQLAAATALYEEGSAGVRKYTAAVNDTGAASRVAATNMNNLSGDVEALRGSLETAFIKTGSSANGVLRFMAQGASTAVNAFSSLPGPVQASALALLAVGTATGGALAAFGTIAPKVREARASLESMGRVGAIANTAIGGFGRVLGAAVPVLAVASIAVGIFSAKKAEEQRRIADATQALLADNVALGENTRTQIVARLEQEGMLRSAQQLGINLGTLTQAVYGNAAAQASVNKTLTTVSSTLEDHKRATHQVSLADAERGKALRSLRDALPGVIKTEGDAVASATRQKEATDKSAAAHKRLTAAAGQVTGALAEEASAADQVKTAIDKLNGVAIDAASADITYRNAVAATTEAIKNNGKTTDLGTQKGRDNTSAVLSAVRAAEEHAKAVADQTGSVEKGNAVFRAHIAALRQTLLHSGLTKKAVDALLASYARTPPVKKTQMQLDAEAAKRRLIDLQRKINAVHGKNVQVNVTATGIDRITREINNLGHAAAIIVGRVGKAPQARAEGGPVLPGQPYIVGEHRPELFIPRTAGTIVPRAGLGRAVAGGNTYNIAVTVAAGGHPAETGRQIVNLIRSYEERSGAGWRG